MFSTLRLEMTKRVHAKTTTQSTSEAINEAQKHKQEAAFTNFPKTSPANGSNLVVFRPRRKTEPPKLPREIAHAALEPVPRWACDQIAEVSRLCEGNREMALHEAYLRAIEKDPKCQLLELVKEIAYMVYCGSRSQVQPRETFSHHWDALLEQPVEFSETTHPKPESCNSQSCNSQVFFAPPACGFSAESLPQTSVEIADATNTNGPTEASALHSPSPATSLPGQNLPLSGQNTAAASSIPFFEASLAVPSASFAAKPAPLAPGFVARWRARFTHFTASVREDWAYRRLERRTARELKKQHKKLRKMEAERLLEELVFRARAAAFEHVQGNLDRKVAEKKHLQQQQVGHSQRAVFAAQAQRRVYAAWRHAERTRATEHKREGRSKKRELKKKELEHEELKKKELKKAPKKVLEKPSKNDLKKTPSKESSSSDSHKSTISPRSLRSTAATSRCLCHRLRAKN